MNITRSWEEVFYFFWYQICHCHYGTFTEGVPEGIPQCVVDVMDSYYLFKCAYDNAGKDSTSEEFYAEALKHLYKTHFHNFGVGGSWSGQKPYYPCGLDKEGWAYTAMGVFLCLIFGEGQLVPSYHYSKEVK